MNFRTILDSLPEHFVQLFQFSSYDLNKFYSKYYGVVNLTDRKLNIHEYKVLGRGLKFCPTPCLYDHGPLKADIDRFFRLISLKIFFSDEQENIVAPPKGYSHPDLKLPSTFNLPIPSNLMHIYQSIMDEILNHNPTRKRVRNMKNSEYTIKAKLDKMLLSEEISDKTYNYLISGGTRTSVFYLLPKIHKSLDKPPGRPIVSSINSPTEKISQLLDLVLQPYVQKTKSYIKDTPNFIRKLLSIKDLTDQDWLFTFDVTSLYTNIPHSEGLEAVRRMISSRTEPPSVSNILNLLEMVLTMNNFKFNNQHYLQISGTVLGTCVAPTYANIFMNDLEHHHVYNYSDKLRYWYRFIDDIWGFFRGTETDLKNFHEYLNSIHETIKFTLEYSKTSVIFLDVETYRENPNEILTRIYNKPTDSHSYLEFSSCHPNSMKSSIPFSQLLRGRRNSTHWHEFIKNALCMTQYFSMRGYPRDIVQRGLTEVNRMTQEEALNSSKKNSDTQKLFLITEYNPSLMDLKSLINKYWPMLDRSSSTRFLVDQQIVFGHRKPKNLSDYLIRTDLVKTEKVTKKPKCHSFPKCKHCPLINKSGKISSSSTGRTYKIPRKVNCNSMNLIYCLECSVCHKQYVGQTKNKFLVRVNQHMNDIKHRRETPVA